MALSKYDILNYYPEEYLLEEDEMGESNYQFRLIKYLVDLLEWYFRLENWFITGNLEFYHPAVRNTQGKIIPDVVVFKDIAVSEEERQNISSWDVNNHKPMPPLVFEISSRSTWRADIWNGENHKPAVYGRMGVKEYFAYDPYQPALWGEASGRRLKGWRYSLTEDGQTDAQEIVAEDGQDRLWSEVLNGWLVSDGPYLRLYDRQGVRQLTEAEAERATAEAERATREAAERRIAELENQIRQLRGE